MMRRAAAAAMASNNAAWRRLFPHTMAIVVRHEVVVMKQQMQQRQHFYQQRRCLQSGPMFAGEIAAPTALRDELEEALQNYQRLLGLSSNDNEGGNSPATTNTVAADTAEIQSSLEKIRKLQFDLQQYDDCLETHTTLHQKFCNDTLALSKSHHGFGTIYQRLKQWDKARKHYDQSLLYSQKMYPDQFHQQMGDTFNSIGSLWGDQMDMESSLEYYNLAEPHFRYHGQVMFQQRTDSDPADTTTTAAITAIAHSPDGGPAPIPHPGLRAILNNQGRTMRFMGDHEDAIAIYREMEERYGLDDNLRIDLGGCLLALGKPREAKKLYKQLVGNLEPDTLVLSLVHHQLGLCCAQTPNQDREALEHFKVAYEMRKRLLGDTDSMVGQTINAMGVIHSRLERSGLALKCFREALVIARLNSDMFLSEEDPEVKSIMKNISLAQRNAGQETLSTGEEDL